MKNYMHKVLKNSLFLLLMKAVFAYMAFVAIVLATLHTPPEALLDSNLKEVLLVFEDYD